MSSFRRKEPEGEFYKESLEPGEKAPDFTLPAHNGKPVNLKEVCENHDYSILVFYRGYW